SASASARGVGRLVSARAQARWSALGMTVVVETTVAAALPWARVVVAEELAGADDAYSPVRADTELARLHAARGRRTVVSARLLEAVDVALGASAATGGLVDPSAGRRLVAAPGAPRRLRAVRTAAGRRIECDHRAATIRVPDGVRLDLGATGKALIADRAAARIARGAPGPGALVSIGGDLATAGPPPPGGWPVRVTDDHRATGGGEDIRLRTGALATSSLCVRAGHIVDPRTGRAPEGPWRTAAVAAATCVDANAASTAALVLGTQAEAWLCAAGLPALLVAHDGSTVRFGGWPA
ncbi:MAG: FAD:protein FMN transferase, partial [Solirubrobacteraceae bacterium]